MTRRTLQYAFFAFAACLLLGALYYMGTRIIERYSNPAKVVLQGTETRRGGPLVEAPGRSVVAFRDSAGMQLVPVEDVDFNTELDLAVEVEREGENARFVAYRTRSLFPDITGQVGVGIRSLGDPSGIRVTEQRQALLSLKPQISAGIGYSGEGLSAIVMLSPVRVWAFRLHVFADAAPQRALPFGAGLGVSTRITPSLRVAPSYDVLRKGPMIALALDF